MLSAGRPYPRQFVGQTSVAKAIAVFFASLLLLMLASNVVFAANPPPVQEFYVPVPEDQVFAALRGIFPGPAACGVPNEAAVAKPIITYISISVISDNTIIYYDHWEDDFEVDVSNPTQASTEIWGDGNVSNGFPPGVPNDIINANTVIVLDTEVNWTVLDDRRTVIDYDASDKVAATRMIAMTRAAWATGSGTLLAGALEVYPTDQWGTHFEVPVGENADLNNAANDLFEYTGLAVMATEDGTSLVIDIDGDGTADINTTIDEGESYLVNGGIQRGATVQASTRVQVSLITGDRCDIYESRWYVLFPTNQWSDSYYSPVSKVPASSGNTTNTQTTVFLYNPGPSNPLAIRYDVTGGSQTTVNVAINQTAFVMVPEDSGAHFSTTDGSPFAAIGAIDTGGTRNRDWDWGFTLVPESQLTRQTLIGWGPGQDPRKPPTENGSPVWVMPVLAGGTNGPINICVDYNGDNIGSEIDSNGFFYDQLLTLNELESVRVFDSDGDQTGLLLYVCEEPPPGAELVAAWGGAPGIASDAAPGLDLGTTAPPAASFAAGKAAEVIIDADGNGLASPGDTLLYSVVIQNSSRVTVENVIISDTLPLNTTYVLSTTTFDDGSGAVPIPDNPPPGNGTAILPDPNSLFPLDDGGVALGDLPAGGVFTVTFQVGINDPFPASIDRVRNVAVVTAGGETTKPEVETPIFNSRIQIEKDVSDPYVQPGTTVMYTYEVRNIGNQPLHAVTVEDDKCSPLNPTGPDAGDDGLLSVGEVWTYACSVVIVQATLNTATVTALDPSDKTVSDSDTAFVDVPILYLPIIKTPPPEPIIPPPICPPPDGCPLENDVKGLAVHESKNLLFVVTRNPDKLLVVNPDTFEIIGRADTGLQPWGIVVNEQTNRVYVSNFAGGDVWIYDVDTLQVVEKLAVGTNPAAMAILPGLDTVFVQVRANSRIVVIQGISLIEDVPAGGSGPFGIAADTVNNRTYNSFRDSVSFSLLRQQAGGWSAQNGPRFEDGRSLFGVAYNGNNGKLYSVFADSVGDWFVDIWMPNVTSPWGRVTTKSVPSGGVVSSPLVGGAGLAVNPATGNVFNVNTGDESVTVIDGDSEGILATIKLGTDPFPIAIDGTHNVVYVGLRAVGRVVKIVDTY